jgi:hypothetical protein
VQDKLLQKLKDPSSFIITKYNRKPADNFYCRIEVIDLPKEEKDNENIEEELPEVIVTHDDSMNTSKVKDRAFRAAQENINSSLRHTECMMKHGSNCTT